MSPDTVPAAQGSQAPRIALFTHDTFGLGHVRRCLHIARALAERAPDSTILLITGSPALRIFEELPPNADYVKIPTLVRSGSKALRPSHLPLPLEETSRLRRRIILETVMAFEADLLLVDNFPLGARRELLETLHALRDTSTRTVLGLRDILDAPEVVRRDWAQQGFYEVLGTLYDRILVYGLREVLDHGDAYALTPEICEKVRYCGYVTAPMPPGDPAQELGHRGPYLLGTGGGGGDAYPLLSTFLRAVPLLGDVPSAVVTGPLMNPGQRAELASLQGLGADVVIRTYVPNLRRFMGAADAVVAMGGYNTAAEIMASGARALIVPRTWRYGEHQRGKAAGAEWEQLLRAQALSRFSGVSWMPPERLTPEGLAQEIRATLEVPKRRAGEGFDVGGLDRVVDELLGLCACPQGTL